MRRNAIAPLRLALVLPLLFVASVRAQDTDDKKGGGDLEKLKGRWTTSGEGEASYIFDGSKLKVVGKNRTYEITVTLDEKAKPEKTIDMKILKAPEDAQGKTAKGIYKFEEGKLVLCFRGQGDRPDRYEMMGFDQILLTLTKEK